MKKNRIKICVKIVIAIAVILSLPISKNAAYGATINFTGTTSTELQEALDNVSDGDTIVLEKDIIVTSQITISKEITIIDNGTIKTIGRASNYKGEMFFVPGSGELTLKGTNDESLIITGNKVLDCANILLLEGGNLNMHDGVVLENNVGYKYDFTSGGYGHAVWIGAETIGNKWIWSHFTMYGGIIRNNTVPASGAGIKAAGTDSAFTMYGGTIINNISTGDGSKGGGADVWRKTWIYGGKIINNKATQKSEQGYYGFACNYAAHISDEAIISDNYILTSKIVLSGPETVKIGSTITISANVAPSNVVDKTLLWYSSDPKIATVDKGVVTGIESGTVTITAVANDGSRVKATKTIEVKSPITKITITGESKVKKGEIINLKAAITPSDATDKTLNWTSSNTNIATVNGSGLVGTVRGISKGTVTITVAANDGSGVKTTKTITVEDIFIPRETDCILLGESINYETEYTDPENDQIYKYSYQYKHTANYYENNIGTITNNNTWITEPIRTFDKTGKYEIQHKVTDNPQTAIDKESFSNYRKDSNIVEKTLYVHRKPIAVFTLNDTTVIDKSYDLDHQSSTNKGIEKWEWTYINPDGTIQTYTTTIKTTGENKVKQWLKNYGTDAKIYLRVQDIEGAWSDWSDDLPIADFIITYDPLILNRQTQKIIDQSFDSKGLTLSYSWTVKKGQTTLFTSSSKDISATINTHIKNNGIGTYTVSLRVTNSAGQQSNIRTKDFEVITINNQAPAADFTLTSNESPTWTFPRTSGINTYKIRPTSGLFVEEKAKFKVTVADPNTDNQGFNYNWKLERFDTKDIAGIVGNAVDTYSFITEYPFENSFKGQKLEWGAYRITLKVTDKPPMPPFDVEDAKSATVTKTYYIVPGISCTGSYISANTEVITGDTITVKAKTSKYVNSVTCELEGEKVTLTKKSEDTSFMYWETTLTVPETIESDGTYYLKFVADTKYGGNGNVTREVRDNVPIKITALKLVNFRITDIVNHPEETFPYSKDKLITRLIPYKTGYYVTFRIDSKGKPENVYAHIDIKNDGVIDQNLTLTKVISGGTTETWEGKFYTNARLAEGTIISIKLDCKKGTTTYNYNAKESWDGRSLIIKGSALQDGRINLTH